MGNYIKKASIHPVDALPDIPNTDEPVTIGSLSLKEQIEKMEMDSVDMSIVQVNPLEVVSPVETMEIIEKIKPKKFTFEIEETYSSLSQIMPHTPKNSSMPSPRSSPVSPLSLHSPESLELSEPSPTIQDIISSRFWRVKEDFEETHKIIYDMMKELML